MGTTSFTARVRNALDNLFRPSVAVVESALIQDNAERHPQEQQPTKRQWSESVKAALGLLVRVLRTARKRRHLRAELRSAASTHDLALKTYLDQAASLGYIEARQRDEKLRAVHPLHEERLTFRQVRIPKWMSRVVEPIVIISDWGVWFGLFLVGEGLSFTKPTSATDPTPSYDPQWFLANPAGWAMAFAVPPLMAFGGLGIVRVASRVWAQHAALKKHPERAADFEPGDHLRIRLLWLAGVLVASVTFYLVAARAFAENLGSHASLAGLIAIPWAAAPWIAFLVRRFGQDPIAEVDDLILGTAEKAADTRRQNAERVVGAVDKWRASFDNLDDLTRANIDGASADLYLFDQIHMRADSKSGLGMALAPTTTTEPVTAQGDPLATNSATEPRRASPVSLKPQRGLTTKVAGWITTQIEQDIDTLNDYRPPVDHSEARIDRLNAQFENAYQAAVAKRELRIATRSGGTPSAETEPSVVQPNEDCTTANSHSDAGLIQLDQRRKDALQQLPEAANDE